MTTQEIAQIYTDLVTAEDEIPEHEFHSKAKISALRTKYHNMLMDRMTEEDIDFADRFDATRKAFELVQKVKV